MSSKTLGFILVELSLITSGLLCMGVAGKPPDFALRTLYLWAGFIDGALVLLSIIRLGWWKP